MTKVREAGSCAEAQWEFVKAIGRQSLGDGFSDDVARAQGISEVARVLGISKGVVRNILDPDQPEQLSLERAGMLQRAFGIDSLARWLAIDAGGMFIPLPAPTGDMERLTAKGVRAAGETAAQVIESLSDVSEAGRALSEEEARRVGQDCRLVVETFGEVASLADTALRRARRAPAETKKR